MSDLRTQGCHNIPVLVDVRAPFSNFNFVEQLFSKGPIQRILSLARMNDFSTMIVEEIESVGYSKEDDEELLEARLGLSTKKLKRLSFFKAVFKSVDDIEKLSNEDYIGYAILKEIPWGNRFRWIVFESVIQPSRHDNNYYHSKKVYKVRCNNSNFEIEGNIYCQQNALTNVCAHAALRTCLSMTKKYNDFSYKQINSILKDKKMPHIVKEGLSSEQIKCILDSLNIRRSTQVYSKDSVSSEVPFQKYIYGSIESGFPVLLGFQTGDDEHHIIPILGHTFNEDTWVPNAQASYSKIGEDTRYVPSETWVSSYLCNDDNFGPHFCLPRQYLTEENNIFVIAFQPFEAKYDATVAEVIAIDYLHSIAMAMHPTQNMWIKRLRTAILIERGWVVLRPVFLTGEQYIDYLENLKDWNSGRISKDIIKMFRKQLKGYYWVVEVSLPELFPANRNKLGEIVLDATVAVDPQTFTSAFMFARFPGCLYLIEQDKNLKPILNFYKFDINSHTKIYMKK